MKSRSRGYTLIEVMMVVAVIAILSGGGYIAMRNVRENSQRAKLEQDVATINNSIRLYGMSGGNFDGIQDAAGMIAKLKSVAINGGQLATLRGSMIDQRLSLTISVEGDSPPFAVWDGSQHRFTVSDNATAGIKEFSISESAIPTSQTSEVRKPLLTLNEDAGWVWKYEDHIRSPRPGPSSRPAVVVNSPTPNTPETTQLTPPVFTPPPPQLVLLSYPLQIMIGPPSTDQWSTVYAKNGEASFHPYITPIKVDPGDVLVAKRISLEPETFTDSPPATVTYLPNPEPLVLGNTFPSTVTYASLGGHLASGAEELTAPGTVSLATASVIPLAYQNSSVFNVHWTLDGSDPKTSATRSSGLPFSNGYPGMFFPVTLENFANAPALTINLYAGSENPLIVTSSPVYTQTINVVKIPLKAPLIDPNPGVVATDATVTLSLDTTGTLPEGVRIYYRTDGSDPGNNNGEPAAGATLWTGATFTVTPTITTPVTVTCRAYPPSTLKNWFSTSPLASSTYSCAQPADPPTFTPPPPVIDIAQYPLSVTINNPNDATYTQIKYALSSDPATNLTYTGPIDVQPGTTINAYIFSTDLLQYRDSPHALATYNPAGVTLTLTDNLPNGYTYVQLGGTMEVGSPATTPSTPGKITLTNGAMIPDQFENNANFRVFWTLDTTDPLSSGSRFTGTTFTNGYPGDNVPLTVTNFGSNTSVTVKYVAKAAASAPFLLDSQVTSKTVNITKITLPPPLFTPASGGDPSAGVTLALDVASAKIPIGARIYYTLDGTDPGDNAGEPSATATLYSGTPVTIVSAQTVKARCYPPSGYLPWFDTSAVASANYTMAITTNCFASDGTYKIYRFNPATGGVATLNSTALFPISSIAYDGSADVVYYTEDAATNYRLAKYDIASNTHSLLGSLTTPASGTWNYTPSSKLQSLTFFAGKLFYIANGTDDLVRIDLSGSAISNQEKIADITNGAKDFGNVGDLSTSADGRLWIAGESELATFNLNTLGGYTSVRALTSAPGTPYYPSITRTSNDALYLNRTGGSTIYKLDGAGNESTSVATIPAITFNDTAGIEASISLPVPTAPFYAVTGGNKNLYQLDPVTGLHKLLDNTAPFNIGAIAYDAGAGAIYYLEDGSSSTWRVGKYTIATGTHSTSLGDLKSVGANKPSTYPGNLVYYNNALYYIHPSSQNLVRVGLNTGATALSTQVNRALGTSMNTVGDLALDDAGVLYWVNTNGSTHTLWQFELVNDSFLTNLGPAPRAYPALGLGNGVLYGAGGNAAVIDAIDTDLSPGSAAQASVSQPNLTFTDFAAGSVVPPPSAAGLYYAISNGSSRIYKLDPDLGRYTREPIACPFVPAAIAYDQVSNLVYYVEKVSSNWRVAKYNPVTGVHTILTGHLGNTAAGWTPATSQPNHLLFLGGQLLFIDNNTDNLRRVEMDGTSITMVGPFASLNGGVSQGTVNAATITADGSLYFASPTLFAKYNVLTKSGYSVISNSPSINWQALVYGQNSLLYGVDAAQTSRSKVVDPTTGAGAATATYTSNRYFTDIAGTAPPVPPTPNGPGELIAIADSKLSLYRANPETGAVTSLTDLAKFQPYAVAYDATNQIIYYTGGATAGEYKLARYLMSSGQHFLMGDLRAAATYAYTPAARAQNLVYFQDGLYYLADGTDDLVKITVSGNAISAQTKVKDLNNNASTWQAGGFAVNNLGVSYFGSMATDFYGKFMMPDGSAFSTVSTTSPRTYQGLAIRSSDQAMFATRPDTVVGDLGKKFSSVNKTTGALTFVSNSTHANPIIDLADAVALTGVVPNLYAVGGNNTSIYKFDGANGNNIDWVSGAPFTVESVAVTGDESLIYYVEKAGSNWRLGEYEPATNTHTIRATLTDVAYAYRPASQPGNLMYQNGRLYYIAEGTDDLVAIEFADSGTPIVVSQSKVTDLNNDVALSNIGDIAMDVTGTMFISASNAFATWNFKTQSTFTIKTASPTTYWTGLVATADGKLLGVSAAEPGKLYQVNKTTGVGTFIANFSPTVSFADFAAPQPNVSIDTTGLTYFITNTGTSVYRVDLATGKEALITSQVPLLPTGIALDHTNGLIYVVGDDLLGSGDIQLSVLDLGSCHNTLLGSLKASGLSYIPAAAPQNLAYQNGFLYYVGKLTDDLVKISVSASAVTAQSKLWDIGVPAYNWDTLAIAADSSAYLSTRDTDYLARLNLQLLTGPQVLKTSKGSDEGADYTALTFNPIGQMVGALSHVNTKGYRVNTFNGATTYLWDGNYNGSAGLPIMDLTSPYSDAPVTSGSQFATDGGANIFRVNLATGTVTTLTSTAPFNLQALAYDAAAQVIYYTENANPNWRLAKYDLSTNTHTILGNLDEPSVVGAWNYNPSSRPTNLSFFDGKLYYVHSNTDDLVRIDLSGNTIVNQNQVADLTNGTKNLGIIGDITTTSAGLLWIASENEVGTFDLTTLSGYTTKRTTTSPTPGLEAYYPGLQRDLWNTIYADRQGLDTKIYTLDGAGNETTNVATNPPTGLVDYAGEENTPALPLAASPFYAINGSSNIYQLNPVTGVHKIINHYAPYNLGALAYDAVSDSLFYLEEGSSASWRLGRYSVSGDVHAATLGDLKLTGSFRPSNYPGNLVYYNQALYYIHPASSNLVKVQLNSALDTIIEQTTINLGVTFITVGDLALDDNGLLYFVNTISGVSTLYRYDLRANTGLTARGVAARNYPGLGFLGGVLYGTGANGAIIESLNLGTAAGTVVSTAQPNISFIDFASGQNAAAPLNANFFAVTSGNANLYRLDPTTGASLLINSSAPDNLGALAFDATRNYLYYLQDTSLANGTWNLGRFDVTSGTHATVGDIKPVTNGFSPTMVPKNLAYYNGALYFVVPGRDDLLKVQLDVSGVSITGITQVASMTGGAVTFADPGDISATDAGMLLFANTPSSGPASLYRYDIAGSTGFGVVGTLTKSAAALGVYQSSLYGASTAQVDKLSQVNATEIASVSTSPSLNFTDFAGPSANLPPVASDDLWAIAGYAAASDPHLLRLRNYKNTTGNVERTDFGALAYSDGSAVTLFTSASSVLAAMTVDASNRLYFVNSASTVIAGVTYERPLFTVNLNSLPNTGPVVASFVGDLGTGLRAATGVSPLTANEVVAGLAPAADGRLRLVIRIGTGSTADAMASISSLTPNSSGQLTVALIGTLQNGGTNAGNVRGLAIDSTGQAYVSDGDDFGVYKASATTGALTLAMHSTETSAGPLAVHQSDTDLVTALGNSTVTKVVTGNTNDTAYFNYFNLWGLNQPSAISFTGLTVTPPPAFTGYFAANGSPTIYRMDPISGANVALTTAPFNVQSLGFDSATNKLYYIEAAATNWRVGRYDVTGNVHTIYNFTLTSPGGTNHTPITAQPENLFVANGGLYTIAPNTDDLVKIDITPTGIDSIHKVADLNADNSQGAVSAAAIDNNGMLYFASTAKFARYDLSIMGGYTTIASNPNIPWSSLVFNSSGFLYGVRSDDPYKSFSIDITTGTPTYVAPVLPKVAFTDISSASGPYLPGSGYAFTSVTNCPAILRTDLPTARVYFLTWQAKGDVEAVAFDQTNALVYYTVTTDSPQRLYAYDLRTDTHTAVRDASFQTDLKLIGTDRPTGTRAHNLTHFNGALYYIATGTDDLYKISFTSAYVIADQVKVADIAGNTAVGNTVGALTIDDLGQAYISFEDSNALARFDMRTFGGYTVLDSSVLNPRYYALTYDSSQLHAIPYDATVSRKLFTVNVTTGARTLVADVNPSNQITDLATSTPNQPALPNPTNNFFAITGGNKNIYRLEPTTGVSALLNNTAPYNLGAIAYDGVSGTIFYLEDGADATWNIGKFTVGTSTHSATLGNIKTVATAATAYPGNLVYYNTALYYIQPGTSSLVKVQLNAGATSITAQTTISLGTTFNTVGDLALDDTGVLYWVSSNAGVNTFYKYNLRDATGFATIGTTTTAYPSLGFLNGNLYGAGDNAFVINSLNVANGTASVAANAQPSLAFTDFASASNASVPAPPAWAIGENTNAQLLKINGYDGSPTITNYGDIRYPGSGGTPTVLAVDSDIEAFAVTADNFAYFVRNVNTNVNGVVYGRPLFRIDLNTVTAGSVTATFVGDLDQALSAMNGSAINTTANVEAVSGLAIGPDGALYAVYQRGLDTAVDKLFKITGLAVDGANNLTGWSVIGDITNGTNLGTQVDALEFHPNGTLYAFDSKDGEMLVVNPATAAVTSLHSTEAGIMGKDLAINPTNNDFVAVNGTAKTLQRVVPTGADTTLWSYNVSPPWGTPTFTDLPGFKFPARNFNPTPTPPAGLVYAVTGGNKDIYSLNLSTGATLKVVDNAAAFNVSSLAYDPVQNTVFYLQDTATGYSLGSWHIATNTHSSVYNLTVGNNYNSAVKPTNLTWWGGYLYFIEPGTDDLIRITTSPTVATQQTKVRDLTANTVAFTSIGDLAVDDTGLMYFSALAGGNSIMAKFNLTTMSGYTQISSTAGSADYCEAIVFGPDSGSGRTLYVARDASRTIIRSLDTTTGAISSTSTATTPSLALMDTSDLHLNAASYSGAYYAVAGGTDRNLYQVNPETGASSVLTTAPGAFAGVSAIAWDQANGFLYYLEETASNFKLGRYSLDTDTHVVLGSLQGSFTYNPASKPGNLAFLRGGLYYIATGTDDLVRIDVTSSGIANQLQIADLNGNVSLVNVGDLTSGNAYLAYFSSGGKLYSFNVQTLAPATVVSTFTQGTPDALAVNAAGSQFYGIFNPAVGPTLTTQIHKISLTGSVSTNVSTGALAFRDFAGPDLSQPDDLSTSFFIGGDFGASATAHRGIARLSTATGAVDPSYQTGPGNNAGTEVKTILPVGNGQVLGGGTFSTFEGQPRTGIVRLNPDGSVDTTFAPVFK